MKTSSSKTEYAEIQKINKYFLLLIFIPDLLLFYGFYMQIIRKIPFGTNPMSDSGLIFLCIMLIILTIIFLNIKLILVINEKGIYIKYFPFHLNYKYYSWDQIANLAIKKYSPIRDYGGWGIRFKLGFRMKRKTAYILRGNIGIELETIKGKKILISVQNSEIARQVIDKYITN